ncbi:DUF1850 domain-containing protein [Pseudothauera lacus]|uniref:DUF1850 domain-containing protein n=1 Tax=Pseudothauera lacus TaxID=2136175 RepID=A0A2T4ICG1_9RHOO|nr:DUF1850 domain-containing protein [Pseudothauera lacus]PTD95475.1 DUF1850 domain-containing protein [Pseudothauera lacus]
MSGLCLLSGALGAFLPAGSFTLAWLHSIEQVRWEEDWRIVAAGPAYVLQLDAARVHGSAAGMEPPPGARLRDGVWHYTADDLRVDTLDLAHSPYTAGYELCIDGHCRALSEYLTGIGSGPATIRLRGCEGPGD